MAGGPPIPNAPPNQAENRVPHSFRALCGKGGRRECPVPQLRVRSLDAKLGWRKPREPDFIPYCF
jgi:hypothetical protein